MKRQPPTGFVAPDDLADNHRAAIAVVVSADVPFDPNLDQESSSYVRT